jgi:hypothetical protein
MRYSLLIAATGMLASGCSALDQITLGSQPQYQDPTKIYLKNDFFRVGRHDNLDRFVCITGPLQCRSWGMQWECTCQ